MREKYTDAEFDHTQKCEMLRDAGYGEAEIESITGRPPTFFDPPNPYVSGD